MSWFWFCIIVYAIFMVLAVIISLFSKENTDIWAKIGVCCFIIGFVMGFVAMDLSSPKSFFFR